MKIALISDIHSNNYYLQKTLGMIKQEKVDKIYCLGDLVGYYDSPHEVIQACIENNIGVVRGNHEHYMLGSIDYDHEKENHYRIERQKESLTREDIKYLELLPDFMEVTLMGKKFYLTHSLPGNCVGYIKDVRELDTNFIAKYDYYCFGHTHRPLVNVHFGCCILNPGSIGQPRDYSRKPSFIVVDLNNDSTKVVKVDVDYEVYSWTLRKMKYSELTLNILERTSHEKY